MRFLADETNTRRQTQFGGQALAVLRVRRRIVPDDHHGMGSSASGNSLQEQVDSLSFMDLPGKQNRQRLRSLEVAGRRLRHLCHTGQTPGHDFLTRCRGLSETEPADRFTAINKAIDWR